MHANDTQRLYDRVTADHASPPLHNVHRFYKFNYVTDIITKRAPLLNYKHMYTVAVLII